MLKEPLGFQEKKELCDELSATVITAFTDRSLHLPYALFELQAFRFE